MTPLSKKGLNLSSLLEQGGESKYFMRGTLYPCRIGSYAVDIAASKVDLSQTSGQYLVSPNASPEMPVCRDISLKGALAYFTVTDLELDKSVRAGTQKTPAEIGPASLARCWPMMISGFTLAAPSYNKFTERMVQLEEKANSEGFGFEVRDNVYQKAMYSRNQIGDFLHFVDQGKHHSQKC